MACLAGDRGLLNPEDLKAAPPAPGAETPRGLIVRHVDVHRGHVGGAQARLLGRSFWIGPPTPRRAKATQRVLRAGMRGESGALWGSLGLDQGFKGVGTLGFEAP
eukprot:CAMPEP_0184310330 /NCGR_PEP_ID=MMETSP1049-20130417/26822_1 /TAXON_ID=77928 /ORGANISM="Proteomonas sulcata, Strain CCMP704" /LENGTH=104 /DNA_ID=CAMNT_0026624255 /DNA_START=857 /DNA_END=1167 /DNA_ORIENTATION=-